MEVGAAELAAQRLQAVVAGEPAAEAHAHIAERQVDLVVQHEDAVELQLVGAARRSGRAPRLVHVGLRLQERHPGAARPGAPLGQLARELLLGLRQVPPARERLGHLEAHVVRRVGVAGPRVPEAHHEPVDRCGGEDLQDSSESEAADCWASSVVSPAASPSATSPSLTRPVSVSMSSSTGSAVGGVIVAMTVSSRSSSSVTPLGGVTAASVSVAFISMPDTSCVMTSGMSPGSASMLTSRVSCVSTPPSDTPGAPSAPTSSSVTVVWIVSSMRTRRKSTCTTSPRTGWRWTSLTSTGEPVAPSIEISRMAPACASVLRSTRASTAKCSGSAPPP